MLATFMEVLDTSVANVSLPHIAGSLASSIDESTWVLTAYLVSNAIVLPLAGWFSALFGRKRFYMICVATFTAASFLCGLAPNLTLLIVFRTLQGIGGGAMQPISQAILVESFPKKKRGMAMAVYGMGVVLAPIIGPTLGGWITDSYSWRWIFLINIPVGILSLTLTTLLIFDPPYLERHKPGTFRMDYTGLGLIAAGLGFLEVFLDEGQRKDWFASQLIQASALVACVALISFVLWELRHSQPVVNLRLLRDRNFCLATSTMFLVGFVLYGSTVLLPIFLQTLMGYNAMLSGLVLSPGGVAVILLMPLVGALLSKASVEPRWLIIFGLMTCAAGLFHMAHFNLQIDFRTAIEARVIQSMGLAFLFVPLNTMAFSSLPRERANSATGLINLARNIGGSTGIATVTTMLARRTQFHQSVLAGHVNLFNDSYRTLVDRATRMFIGRGSGPVEALHQSQALVYRLVQREATTKAFIDAFWLLGVIFLAIVPVMLLSRNWMRRES
ncbi:MAG: EmrB/QacA family drug resistance transporter [Terriglobia bacterium]|nr:MAG: EmrB/QacA family drug resistance transporter [Terriglobia bacterium]